MLLFARMAFGLLFTLVITGENSLVSLEVQVDKFVMVDKGIADIPVILYKDAPPRTVEATKELINYIYKISGAKLQLIIGEPKVIPLKAIWVGFQPAVKPLFKNINFKLEQEEIIIAANKNHLVILGRDVWDSSVVNIKMLNTRVKNFQKECGTVNAIYTFLQDYLGVRWFMPNDIGEDYIQTRTIAFKPFVYRYSPPLKARAALFVTMMPGRESKETSPELWCQRNRVFNSSVHIDGGHPFNDWWEKYNKTYPDIFALTTKGTRKPLDDTHYVKLCVSNVAIDELWLKGVEEELKSNPFQEIFNVNENDGYGSGFCTCAKCRKLDVKDMFDKAQNLSDRHLNFANRLAAALKKRYPNKNYKVNYFAYGPDRPLPLREKPSASVIVTSVSNFHLWRKTPFDKNEANIKEYTNWSGIVKEVIWRPNLGSPVGLQWGMPDIAPSQAFEDFSFVAKHGAKGVFFDSFQEHWATQGPQYYVTAQLAWNPYIEKETLLNDYYSRSYGPAAALMKSYWELMERTRQQHLEVSKMSRYARFSITKTYNAEWLKKSYGLLNEALAKVSEADKYGKFRKRVEFAKNGLQFTELIVAIRKEMIAFEEGNQKSKAKVEALWDKVYVLKDKMSPDAINFVYVKHIKEGDTRKRSKRMLGLEPSQPLEGIVLRKKIKEESHIEDE